MPSTSLQQEGSDTQRAGDSPVVAAQDLTKIFKDFWHRDRARAVDGISFHINPGEIFGLLGPNGSGKSTTIKLMLGLLKRTRGRLMVFGKGPSEVATKKRIGYLPEESYLYPFLNARETLDYYGKLFQLDRRTRERRIDELLEMVGLTAVQHRQIREYSKGMQRRIGIAQALINDPEFLILDEPTTGLDPIGTRQVKDLILELGRRGKTVLLSSHLLADVEDCVDRMVILYGGKIRAEGTCAELLEARDRSVLETDELDDKTVDEIRTVLNNNGHTLRSVAKPRQRLEELFVGLVERARAEQVATSGALGGGGTAAFLRGDAQPEAHEGGALIEQLVTQTDAPEAMPEPEQVSKADQEGEAAQEVIEELLGGAAKSTHASEQAPQRSEDASAAPEVDESLIADLLGDQNTQDDTAPRGGDGS